MNTADRSIMKSSKEEKKKKKKKKSVIVVIVKRMKTPPSQYLTWRLGSRLLALSHLNKRLRKIEEKKKKKKKKHQRIITLFWSRLMFCLTKTVERL